MKTEILQVLLAKGSGVRTLHRFLNYVNIDKVNNASDICSNPEELSYRLKIPLRVSTSIRDSLEPASKLLDEISDRSIKMLWIGHPDYPRRLLNTYMNESPPVLFVHGNLSLIKYRSVGFCGSRHSSEKGLAITKRCCKQLVNNSCSIVSGHAKGVDTTAHKTALEAGGTTIIVLPEGILKFRLKHVIKEYASDDNLLVISQFPPNNPWNPNYAMTRNRTIIGLSSAMILIESGNTGGTYAAGVETLKTGVPLFVVDYMTPGKYAEANGYFINKGGYPIRGNREGKPNLELLFSMIAKQTNYPVQSPIISHHK